MNDQDKILSFLRVTGPVLPAQVAKNINSNILLASAHLSELSSQGKIKLSRLKIGGSPLYFLPEHREKLQNFIHHLNLKDQQTLNTLKERKILRENNLDLLTRVSLRNLKDFAIPLNISSNQNRELFWKWYLLDDSETTALIKSYLAPPTPVPAPSPKTSSSPTETTPSLSGSSAPQTKEEKGEKTERENKEDSDREEKEEEKEEEKPVKKPFIKKIRERFRPKRKEIPDKFFPQIDAFFQERNIKIESKETLRKNSEMNFILEVPSVVGRLKYFCKAKNKRRCDEKDLSGAYMEAQAKKLPLLFLYTSELSKKAQEMLDSGAFENLMVRRLS